MLRGALLHEIAGTGRRAVCLAGLLVALWPAGNLAAEPAGGPNWPVPEKAAPTFQGAPLQQQPGSSSKSASPFSPGNIVNSLRNSIGSFGGSSEESLPAPEAQPESTSWPDEQKMIPMTRPDEQGDVTVEDHHGQISLMVRDASLRQVIALIAETQKLNLVFATPAETRITASFDRVPWQQVFDSLLSSSGHTWTTNNGVIMVASINNADSLPPGAGGRHVEIFDLDFASAVDVDQSVKGLLSSTGQSWIMETSSGDNRRTREAITVVDYPANLQQIGEYIGLADQPPRQVLIEAHILQIDLSDDCRSGVNFDALTTSASGNTFNLQTVGFANPISATSTGFFLEATGGAVESLVELLQTTTDAKTLASPKVLVVSGQQAKMQVGEKLGFRVTTTTQTSTLEEIQFLDVGVVLTVTPRVTRDGRVLMRIKPEVSTGQVIDGLPSEETTEVETDIMLRDGQGMVIGGLIQESDSNIQSKIPWLGDLPYVGILFQRRQVVKTRSEIVVTLVPHIQPYTPIVAARENHELMQTLQPLTIGPLDRFHRPYESQLPDTFLNPRRPLIGLLEPLPPVEQAGNAACQLPPTPEFHPPTTDTHHAQSP